MARVLLIVGGILNAIFLLLHLLLGYQIHQLSQLAPEDRGLMQALNVAVVLFVFFFAYASFLHGKELFETGLGRAALAFASLLYLSRAAEEFFLFKFTAAIFGTCLLVGAIYAALLLMAIKRSHKSPLMSLRG